MPRHSRNANQFLPVYCRENARESRFKITGAKYARISHTFIIS